MLHGHIEGRLGQGKGSNGIAETLKAKPRHHLRDPVVVEKDVATRSPALVEMKRAVVFARHVPPLRSPAEPLGVGGHDHGTDVSGSGSKSTPDDCMCDLRTVGIPGLLAGDHHDDLALVASTSTKVGESPEPASDSLIPTLM